MKKANYLLITLIIGLTSCGKMDSLSQFSKRKYLKKPTNQKAIKQAVIGTHESFASTKITHKSIFLEESPVNDYEKEVEIIKEILKIDNSSTYKYGYQPKQLKPLLLTEKSTKPLYSKIKLKPDEKSTFSFWQFVGIISLGLLSVLCILISLTGFIIIIGEGAVLPGMGIGIFFAFLAVLFINALRKALNK